MLRIVDRRTRSHTPISLGFTQVALSSVVTNHKFIGRQIFLLNTTIRSLTSKSSFLRKWTN